MDGIGEPVDAASINSIFPDSDIGAIVLIFPFIRLIFLRQHHFDCI